MRRIDLLCKLLAPAIAGIFLQHAGPFATTIIVAGWNVISFFCELLLVWLVYRLIPTLAVKKTRKQSTIDMTGLMEEEEGEGEEVSVCECEYVGVEGGGGECVCMECAQDTT
jgi:iron-regulated transporter 1